MMNHDEFPQYVVIMLAWELALAGCHKDGDEDRKVSIVHRASKLPDMEELSAD